MYTKEKPKNLHLFLLLWSTQAISQLGSSLTSFALILWSYQQAGSALATALLSICSYTPYVVFGMFAGSWCDGWDKKKTMLICDSVAAATTLLAGGLFMTHQLRLYHLYVLNLIGSFMNAIQQPCSDVAITLLTPRDSYQKAASLKAFSNSLITVLTPMLAMSLYTLLGMQVVLLCDVCSFLIAFIALCFYIPLPRIQESLPEESVLQRTKSGLLWLKDHRGILDLILFLAAINLVASMNEAALAPMLLSRKHGGNAVLGVISSTSGLANLAGSLLLLRMKPPKNRIRCIKWALLFSMSTENFFLALGKTPGVWCTGVLLGWLFIPLMNMNMDVVLRSEIPVEMQGRVYATRNSLQFFSIPIGYFLGGLFVDRIGEPFVAHTSSRLLTLLFGNGKGSGAAILFFLLGIGGMLICFLFGKDRHLKALASHQQHKDSDNA